MQRIFLLLLSGIVLIGSGDASDEERGFYHQSSALGLFYLFSPADSGHAARAQRLRNLAKDPDHPFALLVVARPAESAVMDPKVVADLPAALVEHLGRGGDYAVLVATDGSIRAQGSGREIERLLIYRGAAFVSVLRRGVADGHGIGAGDASRDVRLEFFNAI